MLLVPRASPIVHFEVNLAWKFYSLDFAMSIMYRSECSLLMIFVGYA